ncbi:hypothetical protein BTHI11S_02929 [Bosea thiooxidans]
MSDATSPISSRDLAAVANLKIVPRRFYGRWVAVAAILAILAWLVMAFVEGDIAWPVVGQFFTAPAILSGLGNTLIMTVCAMTLGIVLGVIFAIMYMSPNPVLRGVALFYIWFFRGTPLLLQLLIWFNLALVFPTIGIPGVFSWRTIDIIGPFMATLLGPAGRARSASGARRIASPRASRRSTWSAPKARSTPAPSSRRSACRAASRAARR